MENKGFLKGAWLLFVQLSKFKKSVLILLVVLGFFMVRLPVTFRVLDADTGKPIAGAVAIAMWFKTKGLPGLSNTYIAKAVEAVSDKNGNLGFSFLFGHAAIFKPHVKVYKAGYVGWDSERIYLGSHKKEPIIPKTKERKQFAMKDQDIFLEPWKKEYTYISHHFHIDTPPGIFKISEKISSYEEAIDYEAAFREEERRAKSK
ncbi:MAG: hypothetical protein ACN4GW_11640 [Desulforhopalus sp.]